MADLSEAEVIEVLSGLLKDRDEGTALAEETAACLYPAGAKVYCNNLTKSQCDQLNGKWNKGSKC